ncbi:Rho GTPase [Pseudogymnoascus australis]
MQLCGGSKTTQRKLVLLYVDANSLHGFNPSQYAIASEILTGFQGRRRKRKDLIAKCLHARLSLWDTAGQEEFDRLRSLSYDDTHAIMLCFSVESKDSLENIESKWVGEIAENCPGVKLVLVALKCDLRENDDTAEDGEAAAVDGEPRREKKECITYQQGLEVARRIGALRYLECSAMRNRGVNEAFTEAARVALSVKGVGGKDDSKCVVM